MVLWSNRRNREDDVSLRRTHAAAAVSLLSALTLAVAACGSVSQTRGTPGGQPKEGGTLQLLGSSDVDHIDTASAYYTTSYTLERAFTRQLFSYPASNDVSQANTPVPDLATEMPTQSNGGVSADGRTYTIHLRSGVRWNTSPARAVTAQDVVLGLKRLGARGLEWCAEPSLVGGEQALHPAVVDLGQPVAGEGDAGRPVVHDDVAHHGRELADVER
jgi:ABC-type oligopeptide transport system substrate-binding subunit